MTEYIKRADAIDAVLDVYCDTPNIDLSGERLKAAILKVQPTYIAPVEVRHGRWIDKGWDGDTNWQIDGRGSCWRVHECSECNAQLKMETTIYCPNCGALMDKEEVCKKNT